MQRLSTPVRRVCLTLGAAGAVAVTSTQLRPRLYLDAPPPKREKLSIYPSPDPELVLIDTPSKLEREIGKAREAVTDVYTDTQGRVQGVVTRWIGVEEAVEKQVKEIIPGDEPLTPGILYVGIATLTGSVIARNRTILLRAVLPPSLFFLSLPYFLPKTSHNLSTYFSSLERKYFPSLAEQHDALSSSLSSATEGARKTLTSFRHDVRRRVDWGVGEIQRLTGLKFDEARQLVEKGEKEARGVAQAASDVLTGKTEEQKPPKRLV